MNRKMIYSLVFVTFCVIAMVLAACGNSNELLVEEEDHCITIEDIYDQGNRQSGRYACFEGSRLYCPALINGDARFSIIQFDELQAKYEPCIYLEGTSMLQPTAYEGDVYYALMDWDTGEYGIYKMSQSGNNLKKIIDAYGEFQIIDSFLYYTDWTEIDNFVENGFSDRDDTDSHLYRCSLDGSNKEEVIADPIFNFHVFNDFILCQNDRYEANDDTEKICMYSLDGKKIKTLTDSHSYSPIYNGEYVYFLSTDDRSSSYSEGEVIPFYLYRVDIDGNHLDRISDKIVSDYVLSYDSIYFVNGDDNGRIYKMDLTGENVSLIVDRADSNLYGIFQDDEDFLVYGSDGKFYINNVRGTYEMQLIK